MTLYDAQFDLYNIGRKAIKKSARKGFKLAMLCNAMLMLAACNAENLVNDSRTQDKNAVNIPKPQPRLGSFGIALENIDMSVKPGDDFFRYVNGNWLKTTEIPADRSRYGGFSILRDLSDEQVKAIIEMAAQASSTNSPDGSDSQKIGHFYTAFMDEAAIESAGLTPIQADIDHIRAAQNYNDIARLMGMADLALATPIAPFVSIDSKDVSRYIVFLTQSGLAMPSRDDYLEDDEKSQARRTAYIDYLETIFTALELDAPQSRAKSVLAFETAIAKVHWTPSARRDRDKTYNKKSLATLKASAGGFPWTAFFDSAGLGSSTEFIVREVDAIENMAKIFAQTDIATLKDYLTASYINDKAAYLPKAINDAHFAFYGTVLRGTPVQRERWKRGVDQTNDKLGEIIGKLYVESHFPESSKTQMLDLIENLRSAFKTGLDELSWMSADTKEQAHYKLAKFNPKIGYPDIWTDYSALKVDKSNLIASVKSADHWAWTQEVEKLGGPIDRDEWGMTPQTVNAYYRPDLNEIVFPAAILQAPFFDPHAYDAVNYGGIGTVIGHEMGHGFDDQGRKTDGDGVQRDWWTAADAQAFKLRADKFVTQFNSYEPLPDLPINGELTLGENIGDLTGLTMAYKAYKQSLNGKTAPIIDGYTGDQRFFMAYAQIWQVKMREAALRNRIKSDPHSPGEYRTNGIVRNFGPWYEAFDINPQDALYLPPEQRVKIW